MTDQTTDLQFGRTFVLVRDGKAIADGTQFPDGHVAIHWTGCKTPTLTPHQTFDDALAAHRDGGAVHAVWQPTAIPQARYADVWPELTGWVQAAQEDGEQIDPAQFLEYMRELKQRALAPVRQWVDETRGAARRATQADTSTFRCGLCNAPWHDAHGQPGDPCKPAARQATGQADTWPLATPCGYCAHTLNWHTTGGRCRVTAGENGCGCTAFVAPDGSHPTAEPSEAAPAPVVGQPAAAPDTDARTAVYNELMWPEWNPRSEAYGTSQEQAEQLLDAYRAAVLNEAADSLDADMERFFTEWPDEPRNSPYANGRKDAAADLRRRAAGEDR
ncbi:hypothetical protein ACFY40_11480 [Streptomyces sp. NPDC012950]|uniref:hypothetical protein n=1 Tax=Streptomyces sp. NPDC012950 TaxID=3364858 RepID=UPI0036936814